MEKKINFFYVSKQPVGLDLVPYIEYTVSQHWLGVIRTEILVELGGLYRHSDYQVFYPFFHSLFCTCKVNRDSLKIQADSLSSRSYIKKLEL